MRPEAEAWWQLAERDLDTAKKNIDADAHYMCAFLSEQAVEKALKALWISKHRTHAPKTHNLLELGEGLGLMERFGTSLRRLNPQYVAPRYPDAANGIPSLNYDREIALELLNDAKEVLAWARKELGKM